jgi:hypothetical protein
LLGHDDKAIVMKEERKTHTSVDFVRKNMINYHFIKYNKDTIDRFLVFIHKVKNVNRSELQKMMINKSASQYGNGLLRRAHSFSTSGFLIGGISPFSRHISGDTSSTCTLKTKE